MARSTLPTRKLLAGICLAALTILAAPLAAQDTAPSAEEAAMMETWQKAMTPGGPHAHLAKSAGTFKATVTMWMDPSAPPEVSEGTSERKMILGGRVLEEKFAGTMMGMPFEGLGHTGYDNVTGKYWGTWIDNMSTGVAMLEGMVDEETGKGTFEGEVSDAMAGKKTPMRIESRMEDGKEVNEFYMTGPGGEMMKSMEIVYERM